MAKFTCRVKSGSRGGGQSAAAKVDYIFREGKYSQGRSADEILTVGEGDDARRGTGVGYMPAWSAGDPRVLFGAADAHERADGRLYTECMIALPAEVTDAEALDLAAVLAHEIATMTGDHLPFAYAVHRGRRPPPPEGAQNRHAHVVLSERPLDGVERDSETWFRRANRKAPELGGAVKLRKSKHYVRDIRELAAETINRALEATGHPERVSAKTYAAQVAQAAAAAEVARQQAEEARQQAEEARRQAELARADDDAEAAEDLDYASRTARTRAEAEEARAAAETARVDELACTVPRLHLGPYAAMVERSGGQSLVGSLNRVRAAEEDRIRADFRATAARVAAAAAEPPPPLPASVTPPALSDDRDFADAIAAVLPPTSNKTLNSLSNMLGDDDIDAPARRALLGMRATDAHTADARAKAEERHHQPAVEAAIEAQEKRRWTRLSADERHRTFVAVILESLPKIVDAIRAVCREVLGHRRRRAISADQAPPAGAVAPGRAQGLADAQDRANLARGDDHGDGYSR